MSPDPALDDRRAALGTWAQYRLPFVAFLVALVPRIAYVLHGAGYRGTFRYDPSVYYAASASLIHGRMPYADYTLVHPPGVVLVLTPFAELGNLTSDHKGFVLATLAFTVLGALNAALVVRVLDAFEMEARAALCGGLFYAVWVGSVDAEYLIRLEPLGNCLMLCGLLAVARARASGRTLTAVAGGAAFGAATSVKLWFAVPLLVVVGWCLIDRQRRLAVRAAAGACGAIIAICGVFFAAAPGQMWSMLVTDQLARDSRHPLIFRLVRMSTIGMFDAHMSRGWQWVAVCLVTAVVLAICVLAWSGPYGPLVVTLLVAAVIVIAAAPAYYPYYNDFIALPLALAVGLAIRRIALAARVARGTKWRRAIGASAAVGVALAVTSAVLSVVLTPTWVGAYPAATLARGIAGAKCVQSDSPMPLIELNVLTRNLDDGCTLWVDVSGRTLGIDAERDDGRPVPRSQDRIWQRDLRHYLFAGQRAIVFRARFTGIGRALRARLRHTPVAAQSGRFKVLRTNKSPRAPVSSQRRAFGR